jgi:uncharacterized protein (DUF302 family)
MAIFARVDHARGAAEAGMQLRPTELLVFGNPRAGTPLMQAAQTLGIDLPLRALVWEDAAGASHLAYDEPAWLARRHGLAGAPALDAMTQALAALAKEATSRPV